MAHPSSYILLNFLSILLILSQPQLSQPHPINHENTKVKTDVFLSPEIVLEPGLVSDKFYYGIDFPHGHIALKSVNAELVDERGNSVPLHQTYLHHWVLRPYYFRINSRSRVGNDHIDLGFQKPDQIQVMNSGICNSLTQYYGLGAETRKTSTYVPDPYGVEVGNPADIPVGYEEGWVLNVHAIDTRGVEDNLGCIECRCDLYNVTEYEYDQALASNYKGGLKCCHDETKCKLKKGFENVKRSLYLRYTVKYVDWEASIVPVKIYIIDVTDDWTKDDEAKGVKERHNCVIEYDVEACTVGTANDGCIHTKTLNVHFPAGGDLIYGVGHQHAGATAITLYGEGGREICSSTPIYGQGDEPGDEAGYVVGMSTCYPSPGSVKISDGEKLTLVSNYSNEQSHTGVMGFFYILVADSSEGHTKSALYASTEALKMITASKFVWPIVSFGVVVVTVVTVIVSVFKGRMGRGGEGYEAII